MATLRRMAPLRQIEAVELMTTLNKFTATRGRRRPNRRLSDQQFQRLDNLIGGNEGSLSLGE